MRLAGITFATVTSLFLTSACAAATARGYMDGGGLGAEKCPSFVAMMTEIRDRDGFSHEPGKYLAGPYAQYIAGFASAFNMTVPGVFDVFGPLAPEREDNALFAIESYCRSNPGKTALDGLYDLIVRLAPQVKEQ